MIYSIRKWRRNAKKTGFVLSLSAFDEEKEQWHNVKAHVSDAAQYAGANEDEKPQTLAMVKGGALWIKVSEFDDYKPPVSQGAQETRTNKKGKKPNDGNEAADDTTF